jgi:hypothetical protein
MSGTQFSRWLVVLAGAAAGCQPEAAEESYLLMDFDARAGGVVISTEAGPRAFILPGAMATGSKALLETPDGSRIVEVGDGELVYVHGVDAIVERRALDQAVAPDRIEVFGTEAAAAELAAALGAQVLHGPSGGFELAGPDVFAGAAGYSVPEGLTELRPVLPILEDDAGVPLEVVHLIDLERTRQGPHRASIPAPPAVAREAATTPELPSASRGRCSDPYVGTWVSRQFYEAFDGEYEFTLRVGRAGDVLNGEIRSHFVRPSDEEWTVRMPAQGSVRGGKLAFQGTRWELMNVRLGRAPSAGTYNVDRFAGALTVEGDVLKVLHNDDGRMRNHPTVFLRTRCD